MNKSLFKVENKDLDRQQESKLRDLLEYKKEGSFQNFIKKLNKNGWGLKAMYKYEDNRGRYYVQIWRLNGRWIYREMMGDSPPKFVKPERCKKKWRAL